VLYLSGVGLSAPLLPDPKLATLGLPGSMTLRRPELAAAGARRVAHKAERPTDEVVVVVMEEWLAWA
jgi:hypothetical protein